jgi:predicted Zn-dependent protease with MMP-like domain
MSFKREYHRRHSLNREQCEALVVKALSDLHPEFQSRLENIDIVVEDWPTPSQLAEAGVSHPTQLLGLYEGIPWGERSRGYSMVPPDKITIFRKPIEAKCRGQDEIEREVKRVVHHEIAHHFGFDDERLEEIERGG